MRALVTKAVLLGPLTSRARSSASTGLPPVKYGRSSGEYTIMSVNTARTFYLSATSSKLSKGYRCRREEKQPGHACSTIRTSLLGLHRNLPSPLLWVSRPLDNHPWNERSSLTRCGSCDDYGRPRSLSESRGQSLKSFGLNIIPRA
jgi:hypothetical protein